MCHPPRGIIKQWPCPIRAAIRNATPCLKHFRLPTALGWRMKLLKKALHGFAHSEPILGLQHTLKPAHPCSLCSFTVSFPPSVLHAAKVVSSLEHILSSLCLVSIFILQSSGQLFLHRKHFLTSDQVKSSYYMFWQPRILSWKWFYICLFVYLITLLSSPIGDKL